MSDSSTNTPTANTPTANTAAVAPKRRIDWSLFGAEHIAKYRETDGEVGHIWNGVPCLVLRTTRRSGEPRDTALIYGRDGDSLLVVASAGGAPEHPWWFRDLAAVPSVNVQVLGDRFDAVARTASAEEKRRLWPALCEIWPDYETYQAKTSREIPVVIIDRV